MSIIEIEQLTEQLQKATSKIRPTWGEVEIGCHGKGKWRCYIPMGHRPSIFISGSTPAEAYENALKAIPSYLPPNLESILGYKEVV